MQFSCIQFGEKKWLTYSLVEKKLKKNDQKLSELTVNYTIKLLNEKNILSKKKKILHCW